MKTKFIKLLASGCSALFLLGCSNTANIKNRQPLSKMLVSSKSLPEYYGHIVKEELNIKEVELGADLSKYVKFENLYVSVCKICKFCTSTCFYCL